MSHAAVLREIQSAVRNVATETAQQRAVMTVLARHGSVRAPTVRQAKTKSGAKVRLYIYQTKAAGDFVLTTGPSVEPLVEPLKGFSLDKPIRVAGGSVATDVRGSTSAHSNPRVKEATEDQEELIDLLLKRMSPVLERMHEARHDGGWWGAAKHVISWLVANDAGMVAEHVANGVARLDTSIYVDDRVTGRTVSTNWSTRVTRGQMVEGIKKLREGIVLLGGGSTSVRSNPQGGTLGVLFDYGQAAYDAELRGDMRAADKNERAAKAILTRLKKRGREGYEAGKDAYHRGLTGGTSVRSNSAPHDQDRHRVDRCKRELTLLAQAQNAAHRAGYGANDRLPPALQRPISDAETYVEHFTQREQLQAMEELEEEAKRRRGHRSNPRRRNGTHFSGYGAEGGAYYGRRDDNTRHSGQIKRITAAQARRIMAVRGSAQGRGPIEGIGVIYWAPPEYERVGEGQWRAEHGWLKPVWSWDGLAYEPQLGTDVVKEEQHRRNPLDDGTYLGFGMSEEEPEPVLPEEEGGEVVQFPARATREEKIARQDSLDAMFQERIYAVRNALREMGWSGWEGQGHQWPLEKGPHTVGARFDHVGAGRNVVGVTYVVDGGEREIVDDGRADPHGIAAMIDSEAATLSGRGFVPSGESSGFGGRTLEPGTWLFFAGPGGTSKVGMITRVDPDSSYLKVRWAGDDEETGALYAQVKHDVEEIEKRGRASAGIHYEYLEQRYPDANGPAREDIVRQFAERARKYRDEAIAQAAAHEASLKQQTADVGPYYADIVNEVVVHDKGQGSTWLHDTTDAKIIRRLLKEAVGITASVTVRRYSMATGLNFSPPKGHGEWSDAEAEKIAQVLPNQVRPAQYGAEHSKHGKYNYYVQDSLYPHAREDRSDPQSDYFSPGGFRIANAYVPLARKLIAQGAQEEGGRVLTSLGQGALVSRTKRTRSGLAAPIADEDERAPESSYEAAERAAFGREGVSTYTSGVELYHNETEGTVAKGDTRPVKEILKRHGFRWYKAGGFWYIPRSRGRTTSPINIPKVAADISEGGASSVVSHGASQGQYTDVAAEEDEMTKTNRGRRGRRNVGMLQPGSGGLSSQVRHRMLGAPGPHEGMERIHKAQQAFRDELRETGQSPNWALAVQEATEEQPSLPTIDLGQPPIRRRQPDGTRLPILRNSRRRDVEREQDAERRDFLEVEWPGGLELWRSEWAITGESLPKWIRRNREMIDAMMHDQDVQDRWSQDKEGRANPVRTNRARRAMREFPDPYGWEPDPQGHSLSAFARIPAKLLEKGDVISVHHNAKYNHAPLAARDFINTPVDAHYSTEIVTAVVPADLGNVLVTLNHKTRVSIPGHAMVVIREMPEESPDARASRLRSGHLLGGGRMSYAERQRYR